MKPKKAEKIQIEIFKKMLPKERIKLAFKINDRIFEIARKKLKSKYSNLDTVSFSKELYKHLSLERKFYDNLFNQFLREELKKFQNSF